MLSSACHKVLYYMFLIKSISIVTEFGQLGKELKLVIYYDLTHLSSHKLQD